MTPTQYSSALAIDTAGQLRRSGCQILAATAINGRPWLKARMPASLTPAQRRHLLAMAWQAPAYVEWGNK
jgi:hypothetical protein